MKIRIRIRIRTRRAKAGDLEKLDGEARESMQITVRKNRHSKQGNKSPSRDRLADTILALSQASSAAATHCSIYWRHRSKKLTANGQSEAPASS